jgi:hypothetical protein
MNWIQDRIDESIQVFRDSKSQHVIVLKDLLRKFVGDMHKATGHGTKATIDLIKRYGFNGEKLNEVIAEVCLRCRGCTESKDK